MVLRAGIEHVSQSAPQSNTVHRPAHAQEWPGSRTERTDLLTLMTSSGKPEPWICARRPASVASTKLENRPATNLERNVLRLRLDLSSFLLLVCEGGIRASGDGGSVGALSQPVYALWSGQRGAPDMFLMEWLFWRRSRRRPASGRGHSTPHSLESYPGR